MQMPPNRPPSHAAPVAAAAGNTGPTQVFGRRGVLPRLLAWGLAASCLLGCAGSADLNGAEIPMPPLVKPLWQDAYKTEEGPVAFAVADLNGDRLPDVAVVNGTAGSVSVFFGQGSRLSASDTYPVGRGASAIAVLPLDNDGGLDLVVANAADNTLSTLLSTGPNTGKFVAGPVTTGIENPSVLASADVSGDGVADLVVGSSGTDLITVLENKKTGGTLPRIGSAWLAGPYVRGLALLPLDPNRPSRMDLAVARAGSDDIGLFVNDGQGRFAPASAQLTTATDAIPIAIVAADLDDIPGRVDLAILSHGSGEVSLGLADGSGQFNVMSHGIGPKPAALAAGKINSDAWLDLAVAVPSLEVVATYRNDKPNNPDIRTSPLSYYQTLGLPTAVAIADMNGDGVGDVLVLCREAGMLRVFGPREVTP